jgi:hypothetical protein
MTECQPNPYVRASAVKKNVTGPGAINRFRRAMFDGVLIPHPGVFCADRLGSATPC